MTPAAADWLRLILGLATTCLAASTLAGIVAGLRAITVAGRQNAGDAAIKPAESSCTKDCHQQ